MIVFKNVSITILREFDQRGPASEAHCHPERELVGRCDKDDFGRARFRCSRNHDTLAVDWSRCYGGAGEGKDSARLVKAWIFDPRDLASINEGHRTNHERLLRPGGDYDLVGITARTPKITK